MSLFKYLEDKNFWYGKYLQTNEAFLAAIRHAPEIALDEIELFYGNRESLLKILESLDEKVRLELDGPAWKGREAGSEERTKIQYYLREKDSIVEKIVALDREVIEAVEGLLKDGLEKIQSLRKGKKALAKYKSSNNYNEKIDKRV